MTNPLRPFGHAAGFWRMATLAAVVAAGVWLWLCWCVFPARSWNDVRLAAVFALDLGLPLYGGENGVTSTWMYGPLPVLLLWPATWTQSTAQALIVAGTINVLITAAAIGLVCGAWPIHGDAETSRATRLVAASLAVVLWPGAAWQYLQADNFAVAVGLLANLALVAMPSRAGLWSAALLATAGVFCKQTSLGVPLAQLVWLASTGGSTAVRAHFLRLIVGGGFWLSVFLLGQDPAAAWFNLVLIPGELPWTNEPWKRLFDLTPHLAVQFGLPIAVWLWLRRTTHRRYLELPMWTWLCSLPFGLAGLMKIGGSLNNLQGLPLWLPPALVVAVHAAVSVFQRWRPLALVSLGVVIVCLWRILLLPAPHLAPAVEIAQQAEQLARTAPGRIWFPWNPLVTVFSERRLYHVEDGMYVRHVAGRPLTRDAVARHLPAQLRFIALPRQSTDWGVALSLLPTRQTHEIGLWRLHSLAPANSTP